MTRIGVVAAALVVAGAAVAQTRRPDPAPGVPLITRLPTHLTDPALVDELKLTPDQMKALAPGGPGKGAPAKAGGPAVVARAKEVLTPEQYTRAVQLMAQDALRTGRGAAVTPAALVAVPAATFRQHPELADAANLTREQKRRVTTAGAATPGPTFGGPQQPAAATGGLPGAAHVVLDPDQTAALAAFVGPLRTTPFAAAPAGRPTGPTFAPTTAPGGLQPAQRAMLAINNRGELKLTDEQINTLSSIMNGGRVAARPADGDEAPPMPVRPPTPAETEAALAKALDPAQLTRLQQIELWQQIPPGADDTAKFAIPRVATAVALTADQKTALAALGTAHREKAAKALDTAESAAALKTALAAARAEVSAGVGDLITEEQGTKLRGLFGPEHRGGAGMMGNDIFRRIRTAGYGNYQFEIMVVNRFAGVAEDLKLSDEQKAAMTAAEAAFNQQFQQSGLSYEGPEKELAKQMSDRSKAMQQIFDENFNPDQKKRFRELCVQLRQQLNETQGGGNRAYPPTGTPGVADELKLTAEQRKRIVDTGEEDDVLTAAQRAELKRLAGVPLSGGFNFGGPARGRPVPPSARLALLHAGGAHADLKLDARQAYLIAEVIEAHAAELRPTPAGRSAEFNGYVEPPPPEVVEETVQACEKACHSVLTAAQRDRLGQLILQVSAHASLTAVFARPEVSEKLGFSPDQRAALDDIAADYRNRVTHVGALPSSAGWPELRQKALKEMREKARDRMMGVLTARQAATWRELTGAACPAVAAVPPPGGPSRDP